MTLSDEEHGNRLWYKFLNSYRNQIWWRDYMIEVMQYQDVVDAMNDIKASDRVGFGKDNVVWDALFK